MTKADAILRWKNLWQEECRYKSYSDERNLDYIYVNGYLSGLQFGIGLTPPKTFTVEEGYTWRMGYEDSKGDYPNEV